MVQASPFRARALQRKEKTRPSKEKKGGEKGAVVESLGRVFQLSFHCVFLASTVKALHPFLAFY
jgi:hypothetical protein